MTATLCAAKGDDDRLIVVSNVTLAAVLCNELGFQPNGLEARLDEVLIGIGECRRLNHPPCIDQIENGCVRPEGIVLRNVGISNPPERPQCHSMTPYVNQLRVGRFWAGRIQESFSPSGGFYETSVRSEHTLYVPFSGGRQNRSRRTMDSGTAGEIGGARQGRPAAHRDRQW